MHTPEGSLWSVWIVVFNEPRQTRPSPVTKYANIARLNRFYQFFALFISFSLCRKRSSALSVRQTSSPPSPVFKNSPHRQLMLFNDAYSRWSTGNRERATSASEVIEVAGSNHAIGVILNLAWGPNNFSPSMIWSWRTRSNSQTGLGAEYLLPLEFAFCFCCLFYFPLIIITLCLVLFHFSYYCWALIILGHCDIYRSWLWYVSVAFFSLFYLKLGAISFSVYVIIIIIIITK